MKSKKYKITFEIEGSIIGDDCNLNSDNIKMVILDELDCRNQTYGYGGNIDTKVSKLKVSEVKENGKQKN